MLLSESTLVKMPHSWKSHVTAHIYWHLRNYTHVWVCLLTPFLFIFSEMIKTYITSVLLLISLIFAAVTSARFIQDTDERYVYFSLVLSSLRYKTSHIHIPKISDEA